MSGQAVLTTTRLSPPTNGSRPVRRRGTTRSGCPASSCRPSHDPDHRASSSSRSSWAAWMSLNNWPLLGSHSSSGSPTTASFSTTAAFVNSLLFTVVFTVVIVPLVLPASVWRLASAFCSTHAPGIGLIRPAVIAPVTIGFATASYLWLSLLDPSNGVFDRLLARHSHRRASSVNWLNTSGAGAYHGRARHGLEARRLRHDRPHQRSSERSRRVEEAPGRRRPRLRVLWSIKLPLMRRSIVLALVFVALAGFLSFDQFYIMTGGAPEQQHDHRRLPHLRYSFHPREPRLRLGSCRSSCWQSSLIITAPRAGSCSHEKGEA